MPKKQPVAKTTPSLTDEQLADLRALLPHVFTEGRIDFEKLHAALGDFADEKPERYSFSWAGKRDAIRLLQTPSRATLIPCPEESVFNTKDTKDTKREMEKNLRNLGVLRGEEFFSTQNIFIEGDNLEVLKLLYKPYFGRVKMIYIDPPYNTGNDFVYPDNFADPLDTYLKLTGQKDTEGNLLTSNPESGGRYHSAWLSMMYPRLFLARQLLREDGVIFISIDDHEVHNLRLVMNEIFGEENFIDNIIWKKRYGGGAKEKFLVSVHEYILFYAKDINALENIFVPTDQEAIDKYYKLKDEKFPVRGPYRTHPLEATKSMGERKNLVFPIPAPDGTEVLPKRQWLWSKERAMKALENDELEFIKANDGWTVHTKQYLKNEQGKQRETKAFSLIDDVYTQHGTNEIIDLFGDAQVFAFPKPSDLIKTLIQIGTTGEEDEVILDFFAGSCATAHAVAKLTREDGGNRKFILVQLPEPTGNKEFPTIVEIGKERIRRVIARMKKEREGQLPLDKPEDLGFKVFKLAESNYKQWQGGQDNPQELAAQMDMFRDPLVEGWKLENVIYEVALKEGYSLNIVIEDTSVKGVQKVSDSEKGQGFYICLAEKVRLEELKSLNLQKDDLFICRDVALDDEAAANLALQCRLKTV